VDLSSYTAHIARPDVPAAQPEPLMQAAVAVPQARTVAPPFTVTRRPPLELSLPLPNVVAGADSVDSGDGELPSSLDVPAFLRRQN
jgi:hypothetical protein